MRIPWHIRLFFLGIPILFFLSGCAYRYTKEGALVGGVAGAAIGYGMRGPVGAALGGAAGALVGAVVGSMFENQETRAEFNETLLMKREMVEDICIKKIQNAAGAAQRLGDAWGISDKEIITPDEMRDEIRACIRQELSRDRNKG